MCPPELLSYNLRATGIGLFTVLVKACGIFFIMIFPFMFKSLGWKTYVVSASCNAAFFVLVYFFGVETKGKTGEEIDVLLGGVKHSDAPDLKAVDADE
jgi:MFS-type transporter involved in bile tolerance (Atg22 family)